jgi:hypothetical protein
MVFVYLSAIPATERHLWFLICTVFVTSELKRKFCATMYHLIWVGLVPGTSPAPEVTGGACANGLPFPPGSTSAAGTHGVAIK